MKILYDHQIFEEQTYGGISRYHFDIYNGLRSQGIDVEIAINYSNNQWLTKEQGFDQIKPFYDPLDHFISPHDFPFKRSLFHYWRSIVGVRSPAEKNKAEVIKKLQSGNYDIFHPTYYDPYFLDHLGNTKLVVTVHDLIHERFPEYFLGDPNQLTRKKIIEKADAIIAVSEATRKSLLEFYRLDDIGTTTIYHGLSQTVSKDDNESARDNMGNYILYVGSRKGYKNFYFMLRAITPLLMEHRVKLICIGNDFDPQEKEYIEHLGISEFTVANRVHDKELFHLYQHAICLICPSLDEGFGYPLLEAINAGCDIACSDTPIFRELFDDQVIFFDPKSGDSIKEAIMQVRQVANSGQKQFSILLKNKFSFKTMIAKHIDLYQSMLG